MAIDNRVKSYGTIWSDWTIGELLGSGSGGKTEVYKLTRTNCGFVEENVLKVVNIIEDIGLDEMSEEYKLAYVERANRAKNKAEEEVNLMHRLRNCNNIVTYQDFKFHEQIDQTSTSIDLLIRMNQYTEIASIEKRRCFTREEVISLGTDICTALEGCLRNGIIHRDIKPGNIFYDGNNYLLGDFGISRILEEGMMAHTGMGTKSYAAPEQFTSGKKEGYDHRVDIYSLGITMYKLLNKGMLPFEDELKSKSNALYKRLSGAPLPAIAGVDEELNRIVLKACSFDLNNRYSTPQEFKKDLIALASGEVVTSESHQKNDFGESIQMNSENESNAMKNNDEKIDYQQIINCYSEDVEVLKNPEYAINHLLHCIDNCRDSWLESLAEYRLGDIYAKGLGVKASHKLAEKYFIASASKGNPYAKKKFVAGKYVKNKE